MFHTIKHYINFVVLAVIVSQHSIECQNIFGGGARPQGRLPGVGKCDAIVAAGVGNCLENYLPRNILSGFNPSAVSSRAGNDICCRYSKYRACISGLHAGFTIAMERERCPKSYTSRVIKSYGESVIGLPLNQVCGTAADGKSRCPPSRGSKPKKKGNQKPKRAGSQEPVDPSGAFQPISGILNRGTGGLGGGDPFGGVGSVFQRGTDTIGQGASGILNRGAGGLGGANPLGAVNPLGAANPFGGVGSLFQTGVDTVGQGASSLFGGGAGGSGSRRSGANGANNPIGGLFKQGADTLGQGASSIFGGAQNLFGQGLGGGLPPL